MNSEDKNIKTKKCRIVETNDNIKCYKCGGFVEKGGERQALLGECSSPECETCVNKYEKE